MSHRRARARRARGRPTSPRGAGRTGGARRFFYLLAPADRHRLASFPPKGRRRGALHAPQELPSEWNFNGRRPRTPALVTIARQRFAGIVSTLDGPTVEVLLAVMARAAKMERFAINERISAARERVEAEGRSWGQAEPARRPGPRPGGHHEASRQERPGDRRRAQGAEVHRGEGDVPKGCYRDTPCWAVRCRPFGDSGGGEDCGTGRCLLRSRRPLRDLDPHNASGFLWRQDLYVELPPRVELTEPTTPTRGEHLR